MTCGVMMYYYAQHTRQVTDFAGIKGPGKIGRRGHLAAARAVNELCDAVARLAPAAASMHNDCLAAAVILQRINDKSATMITATMITRAGAAIAASAKTAFMTVCDNKLKRSVINYHALRLKAGDAREGGLSKGDTPFMFISPFDINNKIIQ